MQALGGIQPHPAAKGFDKVRTTVDGRAVHDIDMLRLVMNNNDECAASDI
jgi:hypothetical protein